MVELINFDSWYRGQEIFITNGGKKTFVAFVNGWQSPDRFTTLLLANKDAEAFIDAILGWEGEETDHYLTEDDE